MDVEFPGICYIPFVHLKFFCKLFSGVLAYNKGWIEKIPNLRVNLLCGIFNSNDTRDRAWHIALDEDKRSISVNFNYFLAQNSRRLVSHVTSHFFTFKNLCRLSTSISDGAGSTM